jgi:hypothetical protein
MRATPAFYQYRIHTKENSWSVWFLCSKAKYEDCKERPVRDGWTYEVRELFSESPNKAVEDFKEALHDHFNEFQIGKQLGIVAIMKHIEKVFKERTK